MTALFILLLLFPALLAILALISGREIRGFAMVVGALLLLALAIWAISLVFPYFPGGMVRYVGSYPWLSAGPEPVNVIGFQLDALSAIMLIVVATIGLLVIVFSTEYMSSRNLEHPSGEGTARYYFWLMLFVGSMIGVAISPNFLMLFWFWEITTLCSWQLISHYRDREKSVHAGLKALIMTHSGGLFFVLAIIILYARTGSFDFSALKQLQGHELWIVLFFFLIAAWVKAAEVPFFTWLPDAMEAPTPVSAYLHAAAMVKAGVYLVARVVLSQGNIQFSIGLMTIVMALITILTGLVFFFYQVDLKRLLAYSTITHLGYILLGIGFGMLGADIGFKGAILHIPCHAVGKTLLFLCVGRIAMLLGTKNINDIRGLFRKMPVTSFAFTVGLFSIMGIPPFSCFFSKVFLFAGALQLGGWIGVGVLIPFALEAVIALFWFLRIGQNIFFGDPSPAVEKLYSPADRPFFGRFITRTVFISLTVLSVIIPWVMFPFINVLRG
jgi:hydrogenase-4 component D